MPNTLAHIGINGLITKSIFRKSDLLWIYAGCIIPDFPWIIRKVVETILPSVNGYELQAFVIVEATLFFSIILSLALAVLSKFPVRTFLILSLGSLLHLLLDPIQYKWANGVHLFAPFNWDLIQYGFFWPESFGTYLLTFIGIIFFIYNWKEVKNSKPDLIFSQKRIIVFLFLLLIYFSLPIYFMKNVEKTDNHFISTLKNYENRTGKYVEMDRKKVKFNETTNSFWIESFDHDLIELQNVENISSSKLSIQGKFVNNSLINVTNYHENWVLFRDGASYAGIAIILFAWLIQFRDKKN